MGDSWKISTIQILTLFLKMYKKKKKERGSSLENQCTNRCSRIIIFHQMHNYKAISLFRFRKIIIWKKIKIFKNFKMVNKIWILQDKI